MPSVNVLSIEESEVLAINPVEFLVTAQISAEEKLSELIQIGGWSASFWVQLEGLAWSDLKMVGLVGEAVRVKLVLGSVLWGGLVFGVQGEHGDIVVGEDLVVTVEIEEHISSQQLVLDWIVAR